MSRLEIVRSYFDLFSRSRQYVVDIRAEARNRLVWFVAISGYALLNAKPYWEALAGREFQGVDLALLSVPWAMSAFLAVITHFLIDEVQVRDDKYFHSKLAAIDLHRISVESGTENPDEMIQLVNDTYPGIKEAKQSVDRWAFWAKWSERLSFLTLVSGFIWSIVGAFTLA